MGSKAPLFFLYYICNVNFNQMKKQQKFTDKVYLLKDDFAPLSFMLPSRNTSRAPLLYFDETTGINRPLRYAKNQKSPFEDEQDGNYILEPIVFEDGVLNVPKSNQVLQKFLELHPANGTIFYEFDPEKDAEEELEYINIEVDALVAARQIGIEKAVAILRVMMGSSVDKMTSQEVKRDIMVFARNNPKDFLEMLDNTDIEVKNVAIKFFDYGFLQFRNGQRDVFFNLKDNKKKLMSIPMGSDPYTEVGAFLKTDEGLQVMDMLQKLMD